MIGGVPTRGALVRVSYGRALRISLNYLPVTFGAVFVLAFLGIALGISDSPPMALLLVLPFLAAPLWLMRCAVIMEDGSAVEIVNPIRRVSVNPAEVTAVKLHTFRLGKDTCPAIVTRGGRRVAIVAATGKGFDLAGWRSLTS
jgi:hypothetical protein